MWCEFESKIRDWLHREGFYIKWNKYKKILELHKLTNGIGGTRLCDRTKMLGCSESGTCECLPGTEPREVVVGSTVFSDYCYMTSDKNKCKLIIL